MRPAHPADGARRPRPGAPRGSGPGGRPAGPADEHWELWNLRALWPDAGPADLAALKRRRAAILAREREALAGLWSGGGAVRVPGHRLLAATPHQAEGRVVAMAQGPYQLLLEIFLDQGRDPLVLATPEARALNAERADTLAARLGAAGRIGWLDAADRGDLRRLVAEVARGRRPVIVYLDGNLGAGGYTATRDRGLLYRLPGRDLRVRAGLARLAVRLGRPLHPVAVHWDRDGLPAWTRGPVLRPGRRDDPARLARTLWDWCFSEIMAHPEQWRMWPMLKESWACFADGRADALAVPAGLRRDYIRAFAACLVRRRSTVRLCLEGAVEVWPGGVLVDLEGDRFFDADGLEEADLDLLRTGRPTLGVLAAARGEDWVLRHGVRLCLLGLARLGG